MRKINGIVAAVLTVLFLGHSFLGGLSQHVAISTTFMWVVWIGVAAIFVHVGFSVATSRSMLNDKEHPPSPRKRRHLALKWVTGVVILLVAVIHVYAPLDWIWHRVVTITLAIALAVHMCVGARSLLKDLGLNPKWKNAFRAVVIVVTVVVCLMMAIL